MIEESLYQIGEVFAQIDLCGKTPLMRDSKYLINI